MVKLVIHTQHRENYGAHDWNGVGEVPQYWKNKGGATYVVEKLSPAMAKKLSGTGVNITRLKSYIESFSDAFQEIILSASLEADDVEVCDPWDPPWTLVWENQQWVASQVELNDEYGYMVPHVASKHSRYVMAPNGERKDYFAYYLTKDGKKLNWKGEEI